MKRVNVLYQFDNNYAAYGGISIYSLIENCDKETELHIYLAAMNVAEENVTKLNKLCDNEHSFIHWLDVSKAIDYINSMETGEWNGSKATWLKIFLIQDLPDDVEKIVYIDSDTIVAGDISEFAKLNLGDSPVAMAYDSVGQQYAKAIGTKAYYNAGVIVYNVSVWKQPGFFEDMLSHLKKNVANYPDNDQRLLNDYFRGKIYTLPMRFNFQGVHRMYSPKTYLSVYNYDTYYTKEQMEEAKASPVILHFFRIFGRYPWEKDNIHPDLTVFNEYKDRTEWKALPMVEKPLGIVYKIETIMYKTLPEKLFLKIFKMITEGTR